MEKDYLHAHRPQTRTTADQMNLSKVIATPDRERNKTAPVDSDRYLVQMMGTKVKR